MISTSYLLAACLAIAFPAATDDPEADTAAGLKLIEKGDALADEGKTTEAEIRYQEAMEKLLPGIRRLPFKHTVKRDVTPREEIRDYLIKELEEDTTPEEMIAEEKAYKAFGLLKPDLDYKETVLQVYTQEIGAFYDPKTDTMHLIKESGAGRKPGLLESLLGRKAGFSKDETKTVIAHELTHALADQHYDLDVMLSSVEHDDDQELALSALIEGEATLVMMGAQLEDWTGKETMKLPAAQLGTTFRLLAPLLSFAGGPALRDAPPIIADSMLFPYLNGLVFCASLVNDGGWSALNDAYGAPPLSTEQILHPEKYLRTPDVPMAVDLGTLETGEGWTELTRNVMGEFQASILLKRHNGRKASEGWDGDQYAVFEGPEGRLGLVWRTTWDTEDDAKEFMDAFARYRGALPDPADDDAEADTIEVVRDGRTVQIERQGRDVAVVEGFEPEVGRTLRAAALKAKMTEKTR